MAPLPAGTQADAASTRPGWALILAAVAIVFGIASVVSGGSVLFGPPAARAAAGAVVPYVVWFNFLSGFVYVVAGVGLIRWQRWGGVLALLLAVAVMVTSALFASHVAMGGPYEMRTAGALLLRAALWTSIAFLACRQLGCLRRPPHHPTHV
jgi:hypothetical protein